MWHILTDTLLKEVEVWIFGDKLSESDKATLEEWQEQILTTRSETDTVA